MPITSESQRNQVALLIALNVLVVVGYAFFILSSVASPGPWLIALLIAGLGYNLGELWFSAPGGRPLSQPKVRTVHRRIAGSLAEPPGVLARTTPAGAAERRPTVERGTLAGRISALGEAETDGPGARIDPAIDLPLTDLEAGHTAGVPTVPAAMPDAQTVLVMDTPAPDATTEGLPDVLSTEAGAIATEPAATSGFEAAADAVAPVIEAVDAPEHSAHSALMVDTVEAHVELGQPVADVAELEAVLEDLDARAEAAASEDAIMESAVPAAAVQATTVSVVEEPAHEPATAEVVAPLEDAVTADTGSFPVIAAAPTERAQEAGSLVREIAPPPEAVIPAAAAATVPQGVTGLASDLMDATGDSAKTPGAEAPNAAVAPESRPPVQPVTHLGGRVRDPVDIVIAQLQSDPVTTPAAAARQRARATGPASKAVPPRAATGLRASSETLAMLRNQLGVGQERTEDAAKASTRSEEKVAPAGAPESGKADAGTRREPLAARRRPTQGSADSARDRVMFVWQGRHFLAPMEGRHPLRVAQSLYDFMVEESLDQA